jgi:hypothetical protein
MDHSKKKLYQDMKEFEKQYISTTVIILNRVIDETEDQKRLFDEFILVSKVPNVKYKKELDICLTVTRLVDPWGYVKAYTAGGINMAQARVLGEDITEFITDCV